MGWWDQLTELDLSRSRPKIGFIGQVFEGRQAQRLCDSRNFHSIINKAFWPPFFRAYDTRGRLIGFRFTVVGASMKKLALITLALALTVINAKAQSSGAARAADDPWNCGPNLERCDPSDAEDNNWGDPPPPRPRRVTVTPSLPPGPPPLGWVYGPYTMCGDPPRCSMGVVNVQADGLNVRVTPNGPPVMSLVNGVPLIPLGKEGDWLLVAAGCDLTPTFAWSWTAGVPLNRCWVYF
jgi:hypothetical protein